MGKEYIGCELSLAVLDIVQSNTVYDKIYENLRLLVLLQILLENQYTNRRRA